MPQPVNPTEPRLTAEDKKLADSILDSRERGRRYQAEAAQRAAEQAAQENLQRLRQARHQAEARRIDEETRAALHLRILRAQEQAKPPAVETPPTPVYTERQTTELELEQAAGRRALARHRNHFEARGRAEGRAKEDTTPAVPGFKAG